VAVSTKTWELMREGQPSRDGRAVAAGACTWPENNYGIPVLGYDEAEHQEVHGYVTNIRREGQLILGDCDTTLPPDACLTVGGNVGDEVIVADDGTWLAMKFEIRYANVSHREDYPWV
jgi:hypothetical protein